MEKAQRRVARGTPAREAQLQFSSRRWQRQEAGQKPLGCPWPGAAASSSARRRSGQWGWGRPRPMALPQAQPGSPGNQATGLGPVQALTHLTAHSGGFGYFFYYYFFFLPAVGCPAPKKEHVERFYCVSGIPVRKADPTTTGRLHWEGALPPGSHYFHSEDEL